ncbi:MAG: Ig-like domain-containing protein [Longimicrobiales bacterium]|nr:Ig-like domain-containing protein [Longimicrobiales bacterium]
MWSTGPRPRVIGEATVALAVLLALLPVACGDGGTGPGQGPTVAAVELAVAVDTLKALDDTVRIEARALDADGNPLPDRTASWSSSDPGVVSVADDGVATAVGNGDATVSATIEGVTGTTSLAVYQVASTVTVSPGADTLTTVGATVQFGAEAVDGNGNPIQDARFLWQSSDQDVATVDTAGLATARGTGSATITAAAQGLPGHAALRVEQALARVSFLTGPTSTTAGAAIDPAVQVEVVDTSGNRIEGSEAAVTVSLTDPGDVTLSGTRTVNAVNGVATFSGLWVDRAGTGYTLEASAAGATPDTSAAFDVTAGDPAQLAFVTQPSDTHGNVPFSPAVQVAVQDAWGNTVPGATDSITVRFDRNPNDATLLGSTTVAAANGVATYGDLRIDYSGTTNALEAEAPGLPRVFSRTFDVTLDFVRVSAGERHTCAVSAMQQAYCWGDNGTGQLGDGTVTDRLQPVPVAGGLAFTDITVGSDHSCGLTPDQTVYCWGSNGVGQLGIGLAGDSVGGTERLPVAVSGTYSAVNAGFAYTCAVEAGSAAGYCWGRNETGRLGTGSTADTDTPTPVTGGLTFGRIDAGAEHTCAITDDASSAAYCWGHNGEGQLGNNATASVLAGDSVPVAVVDTFGGLAFTDIAAGFGGRSCGTTGTRTYCWGIIGDGTTNDSIAQPVSAVAIIPDSTDFDRITVGERHVCGVRDANAALYCWGRNESGQLGNGGVVTATPYPELITFTDLSPMTGGVSAASAGLRHTCAITRSGVYCWGLNDRGQLGTGSTADASAPVRVRQ